MGLFENPMYAMIRLGASWRNFHLAYKMFVNVVLELLGTIVQFEIRVLASMVRSTQYFVFLISINMRTARMSWLERWREYIKDTIWAN